MRKIVPIIGLALLLCPPALAAQDDDFLIVPGERVGRVTKDSTEKALVAIYGKDRVKPHFVELGEGMACRGTKVLFDNGESLEISWRDDKAKTGVVSINVVGRRWKTREGVHFGIRLKALEKINGRPFSLAGFEFDYAGTVTSWNGGALAAPMPQKSNARVVIRLMPNQAGYSRVTPEEGSSVGGDRDFLSSHPVMRKLNPRTYQLRVGFGGYCKSFERG